MIQQNVPTRTCVEERKAEVEGTLVPKLSSSADATVRRKDEMTSRCRWH
jgi:hypothetical protein